MKKAIKFAEEDEETLVIITTDHGNANPGLIYGKNDNEHFDTLMNYTHSNEWILNAFDSSTSINYMKERISASTNVNISDEQAIAMHNYYDGLIKSDGLYNPRNLPFKKLGEFQKDFNSIGWISMHHSADYVELAMYGPGSNLIKPFIKNTDLHYLMLEAAEVENNF